MYSSVVLRAIIEFRSEIEMVTKAVLTASELNRAAGKILKRVVIG